MEALSTQQFTKSLLGCDVHFFILRMKKSFFLWVGCDSSFKPLAVAMNTRLDSQPVCSQLLGDSRNTASLNLSRALALKTGCQCFVTMNITDEPVRRLAEEHVIELCTKHCEMFYF